MGSGKSEVEFHVFHYPTHSMVVTLCWGDLGWMDSGSVEIDRDGSRHMRGTDYFHTRESAERFAFAPSDRFTNYSAVVH